MKITSKRRQSTAFNMRTASLFMGLALVAGVVGLASAVSLSFLRLNYLDGGRRSIRIFICCDGTFGLTQLVHISDDFCHTPNYQETVNAHRLFVQFCTS
jgi:hypothetical protein